MRLFKIVSSTDYCSKLQMHKKLIRMDVRIYSVKAENQAVNIWVYVMTTHKKLSLGPQIFTENLTVKLLIMAFSFSDCVTKTYCVIA